MKKKSEFRHPNDTDLFTPLTEEFVQLLERMREVHGSWRVVAWKGEIKLRTLRDLRLMAVKTVSLTKADRLITGTGVGDLSDFVWFTAADLVRLGVWKPNVYVQGSTRLQGDRSWEVDVKEQARERRRLRRELGPRKYAKHRRRKK